MLVILTCLAAVQIAISTGDSTPRPIAQLVHTKWTAKDGAPTEIRALAQTSDGYLWLGGIGLVRFDGLRFVRFVPQGGDTVPSTGVKRLLASRDGSLWVVWTTGAVSRMSAGRLTTYGERDGLPATFSLTESSTGVLVAGTAKGLARFDNGKWKEVGSEWQYPGTESQAVWFDRDGVLWAQTQDRVVYLPAGSRRFVDPGMPLTRAPAQADFARARDGTVWMSEMYRSAHTLHRVGDTQAVTEVMVGTWTLVIDRRGSLWVGSLGDGLRRVLDPTRIRGRQITQFGPEAEQFTEKDGLQSGVIFALLEDREGNIWVATPRGLERFREGAFTPLAIPGSARAHTVYAGRDTSVWVTSYAKSGFLRLSARGQEAVDTNDRFIPHSTTQDTGGVFWAFEGPVVYRLEGRRFMRVPARWSDALNFRDIVVDAAGTVWLLEQKSGLFRMSGDSLVQIAALAPSASTTMRLLRDRKGRIWVGQQERVAVYDHGQLQVFDAAKGEAPQGPYGFFEDRSGAVWAFGTFGLSKFEGSRFRTLPERQGVPGRSVYWITDAEDGAWWLATPDGVLRLPPGEADRGLAESTHVLRYRSFDARDGLPGIMARTGGGPLVTRGADGRIWVGTDSGVANVDPRSLQPAKAPPVLIEALRIDGRELRASDGIAIPPKSRDLEIDYTAATLAIPERVQFRYQLEGEDPAWRDVGTRRRAYYTGLGPGTYRFRVTASSGDGVWNETGASLEFRVLPAWYQTAWFRAGAVLLIAALGAAAAALVQRRRHRRSQEALRGRYEATLVERARIAQDLHDTLLQGFAGVTLQLKTAELALPEQPDVAAETITRVQQLARASLREARERVWEMREPDLGAHDLLAALESVARERTLGSGIEVSVTTAGQRRRLTRSLEDGAFRIGREAIVNAVRHAEPRRIEIEVDFRPTSLRLEVRDDGRGFTRDEAEKARGNGHFGLSGARERATRLGGACDVRPRPGGGTVIALELPLAEPRSR